MGYSPSAESSRLKTVIHVHTNYSFDSNTSPKQLVRTAINQGVDCIAVTDHDEIRGALEAREIGDVKIIVGEEITTRDGHLIGLFLRSRIPPRLCAIETAKRIKDQGGVVMAPHPFLNACRHYLGRKMIDLLPYLDGVEVCNAQNVLPWTDAKAWRFALRHGLPAYAGADTHLRGHLDGCYQLISDFDGPEAFVRSIANAELFFGRFGLPYLAQMAWRHIWQEIARRPLGTFGENYYALQRLAPAGAGTAK
jgi:hypothetical protein